MTFFNSEAFQILCSSVAFYNCIWWIVRIQIGRRDWTVSSERCSCCWCTVVGFPDQNRYGMWWVRAFLGCSLALFQVLVQQLTLPSITWFHIIFLLELSWTFLAKHHVVSRWEAASWPGNMICFWITSFVCHWVLIFLSKFWACLAQPIEMSI